MEAAPAPPAFETAPEVELLEVFREREVTIFGVTGTLGDLAEFCPKDLQGESTAALNEFVVKAANEAGLEIDREYEPVFTKYIEQNKLERKVVFISNKPVEQVNDRQAAPEPTVAESPRKEITATGDSEPSNVRPRREPEADVPVLRQVYMAANKIEPPLECVQEPLRAADARLSDTVRYPQAIPIETAQTSKQTAAIPAALELRVEIAKPAKASPIEAFSETPDSLAAETETLELEIAAPQVFYPGEVVLLSGEQEPIVLEDDEIPGGLSPETASIPPYYAPRGQAILEAGPVLPAGELPAAPEEIAAVLEVLARVLEAAEPQRLQRFEVMLETIMRLPDKLDIGIAEHTPIMEEKLEALFVQLFEEAGIDYTQELVDSFVILTKNHFFPRALRAAEEIERPAQFPGEIGTREFLQALQHGLSRMRQAVFHFYEIGKSVVRLYGLQTAERVA